MSRVPAPHASRSGRRHSIVLFRALQLGDLLCAVPAFRALRCAFPESRITLAGLPWADGFVARFRNYIDEFVAFPGAPQLPEQVADVARLPGFFADMQARKFDLAVQMHGSGTHTNAIVGSFGATRTVGFHPRGAPASADQIGYPEHGHEIRRLLRLIHFLGLPLQGDALEFPLYEDDYREAFGLSGVNRLVPGRYVCLHPGARDPAKRWPVEHFARLGDALHDCGYDVVLTGSGEERPLTAALARAMRAPATDCAAPVSIGAIAALMSRARLLVTNDTGVSHVAAGIRLPSVVVFMSTDLRRWAPLDASRHRVVHDPAGAGLKRVLRKTMQLLAETCTPDTSPAVAPAIRQVTALRRM